MFPTEGVIKTITGFSDLKNDSSVKFCNLDVRPGQKIEKLTAHPSRGGTVIATGDSRADARRNAMAAVNTIRFTY